MTLAEAEALAREGITALRTGNGAAARLALEQAIAGESGMPAPWLLLAQACNLVGDHAAEIDALEQQLVVEMRNLPALLMMGNAKARGGDDRAASSFYRTAINVAAVTTSIPPNLVPMLQAAESHLQRSSGEFEAHLLEGVARAGLANERAGSRVRQALDLLLGKSQLYLQQPNMFYFPGLPQRQFYEREEFSWIPEIEAAVPDMQRELAAVMAETTEFDPYVAGTPGRPRPANPLLDDPSWGAFYFWQGGRLVEDNAARCPLTVAALEAVPMPVIGQRSPIALYSVLKAGTHIQPHHGMLNTRLICHVPLLVPGHCALRVGSETREWKEGETLLFDDSFEHEAWNRSDRTRVILLFEAWRPEITPEEREALAAIFETINDYQGVPADQG